MVDHKRLERPPAVQPAAALQPLLWKRKDVHPHIPIPEQASVRFLQRHPHNWPIWVDVRVEDFGGPTMGSKVQARDST
eukprot:10071065-Prorocentrum_lima.AAC.1